MTAAPDQIASLVLQEYARLPAKRKPIIRDNGAHEWVPLSGIVAQRGSELQCLSLATGMKCLPHFKLPLAHGNLLHDWHAEVLAIRAFNRFVLDECQALAEGKLETSEFLRRRGEAELSIAGAEEVWHGQPFAFREDVKLHMYCSEAPCGDASMELTMAAQEDASPWEVPQAVSQDLGQEDSPSVTLPGRAYFSELGLVRRKPARGDAPQTLSKSCSDKLSLHQCTSLLSSLTSLFVCPSNVYIHTLVVPESQYSASGCTRAFSDSGRMSSLKARTWPGGYHFSPFEVEITTAEFTFSKSRVGSQATSAGQTTAASNLAVAWTRHGLEEATLGGVLQGRKAFDPRGASFASRLKIWTLALEVAGDLGTAFVEFQTILQAGTYGDVKATGLLEGRRRVKQDVTSSALRGWVTNAGDDTFAQHGAMHT